MACRAHACDGDGALHGRVVRSVGGVRDRRPAAAAAAADHRFHGKCRLESGAARRGALLHSYLHSAPICSGAGSVGSRGRGLYGAPDHQRNSCGERKPPEMTSFLPRKMDEPGPAVALTRRWLGEWRRRTRGTAEAARSAADQVSPNSSLGTSLPGRQRCVPASVMSRGLPRRGPRGVPWTRPRAETFAPLDFSPSSSRMERHGNDDSQTRSAYDAEGARATLRTLGGAAAVGGGVRCADPQWWCWCCRDEKIL